ncbi:MAG: sensor histidine kinase, partial [Chloroflexota bacterium]
PGTVVRLVLADAPDQAVVSVIDDGAGVRRADVERVFDRFYRVHKRRRKTDGSGLGLYICRGIVAAHGGRIWVRSTLGQGSSFSFSLPKRG